MFTPEMTRVQPVDYQRLFRVGFGLGGEINVRIVRRLICSHLQSNLLYIEVG
jgi:hypothetical protein